MNDLSAKRELATEAKASSKARRSRRPRPTCANAWSTTLVTTAATTEKKLELVAEIKVIDEIAGQLRALDQRVQRRRARPEPGQRLMAEGLDSAADLFRQEIAPGSDRARDESGRFSSVSSRPEPLFEPRPLEGDEKTGDTRDAGDDERLKAIERRVADGRGEEGDAEELARLSDDAARARDAEARGSGTGAPKARPTRRRQKAR